MNALQSAWKHSNRFQEGKTSSKCGARKKHKIIETSKELMWHRIRSKTPDTS